MHTIVATATINTSKAKGYYTPDGSQPTTASTLYSTAISVSQTTTIAAIAVAPASLVSAPAADAYMNLTVGFSLQE